MQTNLAQGTPENVRALSKQLLHLVRKRPFEPFRIHLTDGRVFDIRFPDLNMVGATWLLIGIPEPSEPDPFAERVLDIDLSLVRQVELIESKASTN